MTKRISKQVKAIADAHIEAKANGTFDNPSVSTREEVIKALRDGKTFEQVLHQVEVRFCSVTSIILSGTFDYKSNGYRSGVYRGFKTLLQGGAEK